MTPHRDASDIYVGGDYAKAHPGWHLEDAAKKADDLLPSVLSVLRATPSRSIRLADVGAGVGGVLHELVRRLKAACPGAQVRPEGFEISAEAAARAAELFPDLVVNPRGLAPGDGPYDVVMYNDVLEHLENPWAELRTAHSAARILAVRQPLLENFSTFRHRNYAAQRTQWGHIGFFNYHSFLDMASACGWKPLDLALLPPWELAGGRRAGRLKRWAARVSPLYASYFLAPFYLVGTFEKCEAARWL